MHKVTPFLLVLCILCGCAALPDVDPWLRYGGAQPPANFEFRRPVTEQQADAALAKVARKGGELDIVERQASLEEAVSGKPLVPGNDATLLYDGPNTYKAMFDAIGKARDHVNLEFYISEDDETGKRLAELLIRKRAQGVAINLIYDSVGSLDTPREYFDRLRKAGIKVLEFNPVNPLTAKRGWRLNHRDHRKITIVDGSVAFTGGINISGVYASPSTPVGKAGDDGARPGWRDINVRIAGPAVGDIQRLFLETWSKQGGEALKPRRWFPAAQPRGKHPLRVIASSPNDAVPAIYVTFVSALEHAARSIHITMAYFAPDPQTLEALKKAAAR